MSTLERKRGWMLLLAAGALAGSAAQAENLGCLIEPSQVADVGSQVVGVLEQVLVERGDVVKKGQPVAQLNSDVERAAVTVAKQRSQAIAELQAAASNHEFAQKRRQRTQDLYAKNFVSLQAKDQAATEAEVAAMRLAQAKEQQRLAQQELAMAQAQLAQRTIRSPLNGIVVERYLSDGERIEERPVLKVAAVDPLRVEVIVPSKFFGKIKPGMTVTVKPDLADLEPKTAQVTLVDRAIDAASNSFRVRLMLPNADNTMPPGLRCKAEFAFDGGTAPAAPEAPAAGKRAATAPPAVAAANQK